MPAHHRFREGWTPEKLRLTAARVGPNTEAFVEVIMRKRKHPEQGYRTCTGVLRLAKTFGADRLEHACAGAAEINASSNTPLNSILKMVLIANAAQPPRTAL
jgi:transposase